MTDTIDERVRAAAREAVARMQVDAFGGFADAVALVAVQLADRTGVDLSTCIKVAGEHLIERLTAERPDLLDTLHASAEASEQAEQAPPVMTRAQAVAALNRMGDDYNEGDVADVMAGNAWVPANEAEWAHYAGAHADVDRASAAATGCGTCAEILADASP